MRKKLSPAEQNLKEYRKLRAAIGSLRHTLQTMDKAIASLSDEEAQLLRCLFVDNPVPKYMLLEKLGLSDAAYYRIRRQALDGFAKAMVGKTAK